MIGKWHLLHPAAVHFPIALLTAGAAARAVSAWRRAPPWSEQASDWLLWTGTVLAWAALGLGLVAEEYAPHVPPAWRVLAAHEEAGWWTVGVFSALSLFVAWMRRKSVVAAPARAAVYVGWALGLAVLMRTAFLGGELVFTYGMGVGSEVNEGSDPG